VVHRRVEEDEEERMHSALNLELQQHQYLRERLRAEFPDVDETTLRDTVEGLTNLPEMLAALIRSHLDDVALVTALRGRIGDMEQRLARLEQRAERKRALVALVMERAEIRKLTHADFTVSLRPTPAPLIVTDEAAIPAAYWKPQAAKLDRKGLLAALTAGQSVSGATLGNGAVTIAVRTR
jgi:Gp157 protein